MLSRFVPKSSLFALFVLASLAFQETPAEAQVRYVGNFEVRNYATGLYLTDSYTGIGGAEFQDYWRNLTDQVYSFYLLPNGSFAILDDFSGLALTDLGFVGSSAVEQFAYGGSPYQEWDLIPAVNGSYVFYNLGSGRVLTAPNYGDFTSLITTPFIYSAGQLWFL
jgi:hypothetical protein